MKLASDPGPHVTVRQDVYERLKHIVDELYVRQCGKCDVELFFAREDGYFLFSYPVGIELAVGGVFHCDTCDIEMTRCEECFEKDEYTCHDCIEKEEKEYEDEVKCHMCIEINVDTRWCEACGEYACYDHSFKCDECNYTFCNECHEDGKECEC